MFRSLVRAGGAAAAAVLLFGMTPAHALPGDPLPTPPPPAPACDAIEQFAEHAESDPSGHEGRGFPELIRAVGVAAGCGGNGADFAGAKCLAMDGLAEMFGPSGPGQLAPLRNAVCSDVPPPHSPHLCAPLDEMARRMDSAPDPTRNPFPETVRGVALLAGCSGTPDPGGAACLIATGWSEIDAPNHGPFSTLRDAACDHVLPPVDPRPSLCAEAAPWAAWIEAEPTDHGGGPFDGAIRAAALAAGCTSHGGPDVRAALCEFAAEWGESWADQCESTLG